MAFDSVKFYGTNRFPAVKYSIVATVLHKKRRDGVTEYNQS